ncbi:MAG: hypothetical protein KDD92_18675 [Caldilineaceae bacterium]|nr:hypothetical protein [Caldilineaceae bacterium]
MRFLIKLLALLFLVFWCTGTANAQALFQVSSTIGFPVEGKGSYSYVASSNLPNAATGKWGSPVVIEYPFAIAEAGCYGPYSDNSFGIVDYNTSNVIATFDDCGDAVGFIAPAGMYRFQPGTNRFGAQRPESLATVALLIDVVDESLTPTEGVITVIQERTSSTVLFKGSSTVPGATADGIEISIPYPFTIIKANCTGHSTTGKFAMGDTIQGAPCRIAQGNFGPAGDYIVRPGALSTSANSSRLGESARITMKIAPTADVVTPATAVAITAADVAGDWVFGRSQNKGAPAVKELCPATLVIDWELGHGYKILGGCAPERGQYWNLVDGTLNFYDGNGTLTNALTIAVGESWEWEGPYVVRPRDGIAHFLSRTSISAAASSTASSVSAACTPDAWDGLWETVYNRLNLQVDFDGKTVFGHFFIPGETDSTNSGFIDAAAQSVGGRCFLVGSWSAALRNGGGGSIVLELVSPDEFTGSWSNSPGLTPQNMNSGTPWSGYRIPRSY